jgi:hypothetical protein
MEREWANFQGLWSRDGVNGPEPRLVDGVPDVELTLHWYKDSADLIAQRWLCQMLRECLTGL